MLLPERPELMDKSVGDCLSVMLQEDMLMGRDRPYGSRLKAEADTTVKNRPEQICHPTETAFWTPTFALSQFLLPLMGGLVRSSTGSQRFRDKCIQERQRRIHLETHINCKVLVRFSIYVTETHNPAGLHAFVTSKGSLEASRGSTRACSSESWLR